MQAAVSLFGTTTPVWWDVAHVGAAGSDLFGVFFDVRQVPGARGTIIEFSAPSTDFFRSFFFSPPVRLQARAGSRTRSVTDSTPATG